MFKMMTYILRAMENHEEYQGKYGQFLVLGCLFCFQCGEGTGEK